MYSQTRTSLHLYGYIIGITILLCVVITLAGCEPTSKFRRTLSLTDTIATGNTFETLTHNGEITITGGQTNECLVSATITTYAMTDEEAAKLSDMVDVKLKKTNKGLSLNINKPDNSWKDYVSVDLDIVLPKDNHLSLTTHNGDIQIVNINGEVKCVTHNGDIKTEMIQGSINARTHNGRIEGINVTSDLHFHSHNGALIAELSPDANPRCDISMNSHNGQIRLFTPIDLSAMVTIDTHHGLIHTDVPLKLLGKIEHDHITGKLGNAEGTITCETHNGSITLETREFD